MNQVLQATPLLAGGVQWVSRWILVCSRCNIQNAYSRLDANVLSIALVAM